MIDTAAILGPATVSDAESMTLTLADGSDGKAQVALAVPYAPAAGDRVLVIGNDPQDLYIIGVLQGSGRTVLQVPGDLDIAAPNGAIRLAASTVEVRAGRFNVTVDRILQRAKNVYLWVAELFDSRSRRMRTTVEETHHVTAERVHLRGETEVVVNGPSINLG